MVDTTPTRRRHDADTTIDRDVVSPTEAAQRLGVTPDAIRARLRRGTIAGERVGGDWRVFLAGDPGDNCPQGPPSHRHDDRHDTDATRHDGDTMPSPALIAAKDETIAILRQELEARTDELRAAHVIISQLTQRLPALAAGEDARSQPPGSPAAARPGANGEATGGSETARPDGSVRRPWWAVWRR